MRLTCKVSKRQTSQSGLMRKSLAVERIAEEKSGECRWRIERTNIPLVSYNKLVSRPLLNHPSSFSCCWLTAYEVTKKGIIRDIDILK
jgi:hypothetical protein